MPGNTQTDSSKPIIPQEMQVLFDSKVPAFYGHARYSHLEALETGQKEYLLAESTLQKKGDVGHRWSQFCDLSEDRQARALQAESSFLDTQEKENRHQDLALLAGVDPKLQKLRLQNIFQGTNASLNFAGRFQVLEFMQNPEKSLWKASLVDPQGKIYDVAANDCSASHIESLQHVKDTYEPIYISNLNEKKLIVEPTHGKYFDHSSGGRLEPFPFSPQVLEEFSQKDSASATSKIYTYLKNPHASRKEILSLSNPVFQTIESVQLTHKGNSAYISTQGLDVAYGVNLTKEQVNTLRDAAQSPDHAQKIVYLNPSPTDAGVSISPMSTTLHGYDTATKNATPPRTFSAAERQRHFNTKPGIIAELAGKDGKAQWAKLHEYNLDGHALIVHRDNNQRGYWLTTSVALSGGKAGYESRCFLQDPILSQEDADKLIKSTSVRDKFSLKLDPVSGLTLKFASDEREMAEKSKANLKESFSPDAAREIPSAPGTSSQNTKIQSPDPTYTLYEYRENTTPDKNILSFPQSGRPPYELTEEQNKMTESGLVFWDLTSRYATLSHKQAMIDELMLRKGDPDSYNRSGSVDRAIKVKNGLFIDHRVGETKRVLFTNIFQPERRNENTDKGTTNYKEKILLEAASSPQRGSKAFRIAWTNDEHNLILESSSAIKAARESLSH